MTRWWTMRAAAALLTLAGGSAWAQGADVGAQRAPGGAVENKDRDAAYDALGTPAQREQSHSAASPEAGASQPPSILPGTREQPRQGVGVPDPAAPSEPPGAAAPPAGGSFTR